MEAHKSGAKCFLSYDGIYVINILSTDQVSQFFNRYGKGPYLSDTVPVPTYGTYVIDSCELTNLEIIRSL